MTVPGRFVTEYPQRCLALLEAGEPVARDKGLLTSFSLLMAASILVIPYERLQRRHPIKRERGSALYAALHALERKPWSAAPFWADGGHGAWHFARIMGDPDNVPDWTNQDGLPSMSQNANQIEGRKAGEVLRVVRNALSHGNIVYLNSRGLETPDTRAHYVGFLSRYEETEPQRMLSTTYRLVAVTDEDFLAFVRAWATWLATFPQNKSLAEAA